MRKICPRYDATRHLPYFEDFKHTNRRLGDRLRSQSITDADLELLSEFRRSFGPEDFGPGLTRTEFNDVMLWLFESIAGFETLPSKLSQWYLRLLWSKYQQAIRDNPLH